jgi:acyl-CoA reductase-like NAD-dependent aldehyde dehydrogenase
MWRIAAMAVLLNGTLVNPDALTSADTHASGGAATVEITDPVTQKVLGVLPVADHPEQAREILDAGERGFASWSVVPMWRRAEIVQDFAARLRADSDALATLMARNMGRAIRECRGEIAVTVALAQGFAERAKHLYGEVMPQSQPGLEADLVFTAREPLGVILAIVPFNAPVELFVHKVIPALLMGNSVVVKMPMPDPLVQLQLAQMLVDAGVPADAVGLVYAEGPFASEYLVEDSRIAAVSFTGSTTTGRVINQQSAPTLRRVFLELGGNDPFILVDGADLGRAAQEVVASRTMNSGQVCCSSKRALVPAHLVDEFVSLLDAELSTVVQGDPLDEKTHVGALISEEAAQRVQDQVDRTVAAGARCVRGGKIRDRVFFEPTLLVGIDRTMEIACDMEVFGPVITVMAYDSVEEAIEVANQTAYGLQASVMAGKVEEAMQIATRLDAGMVVVNGAGSYRHIDMPFGGTKNSGTGREGITSTLEEFSQTKSYVLKGAFGWAPPAPPPTS